MILKRVQGLAKQEWSATWNLRRAFAEARNRDSVGLVDRSLISASNADDLGAGNPYARVLWGNALWTEFSSHFDLTGSETIPEVPLFWVTLVDIDCMTSVDARDVDPVALCHHLRRGLRDLSYIGMVDPALYANIQPRTNYAEKTGVNWHLHLFVWGESRRQMKDRAKFMNEASDNYWPIVPRPKGEGFNWSEVTSDNFVRRFRYMCKTPRKAYRIGPTFVHSKSNLRPGQRVTLFHLLKKHCLDAFTVAGGEGVGIRRAALRRAISSSQHFRR